MGEGLSTAYAVTTLRIEQYRILDEIRRTPSEKLSHSDIEAANARVYELDIAAQALASLHGIAPRLVPAAGQALRDAVGKDGDKSGPIGIPPRTDEQGRA